MTAAANGAAYGQAANTSPSNVNILNLLAPFLTLNSTATGQATLHTNLQQSIATNNGATLALQQQAISDKNLLGSPSNTVVGLAGTYGIAANLGGGLPPQAPINGITPQQAVGGLGAVLGQAYVTGVQPGAVLLPNTVSLLNNAYNNITSRDLGVAKNYFADGAASNSSGAAATSTPAVAPPGYTLPTANGLPNTTNSVYDLAYGVTNTQAGQDVYGSSRPVQVAPNQINQFDPTALSGLGTNPSFPSGHTTYAYTDSILLGMLVPQEYQSMLLRASSYANSRIVLGVHYPLDIIGSRALASYDLAQAFTNTAYQNGSATTIPGGTANTVNLPALFNAASPEIQTYLTAQGAAAGCGATIAACATSAANTANDPYVPSAANQALYQSNLTYGLPTLTFAQAPREAAPAGGPDASILLAPIYGGSTTAATTIAPTGGTQGTLSTNTINQILVNTETNALAAFYGTSLSYWTRIDLYTAAGYFSNVTGTLVMASTDTLNAGTNVTIGSGGVLYANGTIAGATTVGSGGTLGGTGTLGNVNVAAGGTLAPGGVTALGTTNIAGTLAFAPGSSYSVRITPTASDSTTVAGGATLGGSFSFAPTLAVYGPQQQYTILTAAGGRTGTFGIASNLAFLAPTLTYNAQNVVLTINALPFQSVAQTSNQAAVGGALTVASRGALNADGAAIIGSLQQLTAAGGRAALDSLSGEGIAAAQNAAFRAGSAFTGSISDQMSFWRGGDIGNPASITLGGALPSSVSSYTATTTRKTPIVTRDPILAAAPRTWRVWGDGFGGGLDISGNTGLGTAGETGSYYGGALGVDYQIQPDWLVGVSAGGSDSRFNVGTRATNGEVTGFHVGIYSAHDFGNGFYGQSTSTFGDYSNRTNRFVAGFGAVASAQEKGSFGSIEFRDRLEVGRRFDYGTIGITPFLAMEIASLRSNGFTETNVTGGLGNPALAVSGGQSASVPAFLGARLNSTYALGNGMVLTPLVSLAYLHEFAPQRNLAANLVSLPGATFFVNGARPAEDAVQTKVGAQLALANGVALYANFDGEFSGISRAYGGRGGLKVSW